MDTAAGWCLSQRRGLDLGSGVVSITLAADSTITAGHSIPRRSLAGDPRLRVLLVEDRWAGQLGSLVAAFQAGDSQGAIIGEGVSPNG